MEMKTMELLQALVVVQLDINIFGGRKTLTEEDLRVTFGDKFVSVPKEVVTLGSVKLIPPESLRCFNKLKQRARRACLASGAAFLNGFAVPEGRVEALMAELLPMGKEFDAEVDTFVRSFAGRTKAWAAQFEEDWGKLIVANAPPESWVREQFGFRVGAFRISPAQEAAAAHAGAPAQDLVGCQLTGLAGQVIREIALDVRSSVEDKANRRLVATVRGVLQRVRGKALGLSFLAPSIAGVVSAIDVVVMQLPQDGVVDGLPRLALDGLFAWLGDEQRILKEEFRLPDPPAPAAPAKSDAGAPTTAVPRRGNTKVSAPVVAPTPKKAFDPRVVAF